MMNAEKEKIRSLFYSTNEKNRALAFELAQGIGCYEEMIQEFYHALNELPQFEREKDYSLILIEEILEEEGKTLPTSGIELTKAHIDGFCLSYFRETINLKGNNNCILTTLPKVLFNFTFVKTLDLSWNQITNIPDDIAQLNGLLELDLSGNEQLNSLPNTIGQLTQLESLSLNNIYGIFETGQDVFEMAPCIRQLKNLKHLELIHVGLREIPSWISELTHLESLIISSGAGSSPNLTLPASFTQLQNLRLLHIDTYTVDIPTTIDQIQSLESLIVQPALSIPSSIKNLRNLDYFELSYFSSDYKLHVEGYDRLWDLYDKGLPEGISRIQLYGWEWLKEMTWLKEFTFVHISPYAFTNSEIAELQQALPNCTLDIKEE